MFCACSARCAPMEDHQEDGVVGVLDLAFQNAKLVAPEHAESRSKSKSERSKRRSKRRIDEAHSRWNVDS